MLLSEYYPPDPGGASSRVCSIAKALRNIGVKTVVVCGAPHYPDGAKAKSFHFVEFMRDADSLVLRLGMLPVPHKGFVGRLLNYIWYSFASILAVGLTGPTDVVWAISPNYFSLLPALVYSRVRHSRLLYEVVDIWPDALMTTGYVRSSLASRVARALCDVTYRLADTVVTLSPEMKGIIVSRGAAATDVIVLPNTINVEDYDPVSYRRREARIAMYSGNLGPAYDFEVLLEAARRLSSEQLVRIVIRGTGEQADYLRQALRELGLANVELAIGNLGRSEMLAALSEASVFVLPYRKMTNPESSIPIKLLEYAACGRPIVCSAQGAAKMFLLNAGCGIAVPPEDAVALAEAIHTLTNDEELARRMGAMGRSFVRDRYSSTVSEGMLRWLLVEVDDGQRGE